MCILVTGTHEDKYTHRHTKTKYELRIITRAYIQKAYTYAVRPMHARHTSASRIHADRTHSLTHQAYEHIHVQTALTGHTHTHTHTLTRTEINTYTGTPKHIYTFTCTDSAGPRLRGQRLHVCPQIQNAYTRSYTRTHMRTPRHTHTVTCTDSAGPRLRGQRLHGVPR
jgi:hypothetical protein